MGAQTRCSVLSRACANVASKCAGHAVHEKKLCTVYTLPSVTKILNFRQAKKSIILERWKKIFSEKKKFTAHARMKISTIPNLVLTRCSTKRQDSFYAHLSATEKTKKKMWKR